MINEGQKTPGTGKKAARSSCRRCFGCILAQKHRVPPNPFYRIRIQRCAKMGSVKRLPPIAFSAWMTYD